MLSVKRPITHLKNTCNLSQRDIPHIQRVTKSKRKTNIPKEKHGKRYE